MIYITGDTHGGFQRFGMKYFSAQRRMNRDDCTIVCGDFGGLWADTPAEAYWLDWLEEKPFTTLFVDGNHGVRHEVAQRIAETATLSIWGNPTTACVTGNGEVGSLWDNAGKLIA